ncbi:hypothetical protein C7974DRAFT_364823 [Boeremia exigua]|uniref:uncharacterized protein n=1 Tax=Boeremia exigua TaxID=749465 RepID=UPI001E8D4A22|nr:uncharacterized protein C7974DRAFT_364823 [Boeremia exigua]KAH6618734.1 hypothetical protein C7974DRAFT_364823 [Boeremia exigua]
MAFYSVLTLTIATLTTALDPLQDFCRLHSHRTAVVDRKLYIDGGFVNESPLTAHSTNDTSGVADFDTPHLGLPNQTTLAKNEDVPSVSGGILWPDTANKVIYAFGGEQSEPNTPDERLWYYDIVYNTWNISKADGIGNVSASAWGAGTTASDKALGYYYGGWLPNAAKSNDAPTALSTMIVYNMLDHKFSAQSGPDQVGRAEGFMLYIPAGDAGLLVYFGGVQVINEKQEPLPMSDILVYDIANARWYNQTASGSSLPQSRRRFCAGAVWPEDRSSYNIYVFGGASVGEGVGYGDVWILSLPSFTWIKFFPTSDDDTVTTPYHSSTCNVYESSQMIVVGGHSTNSTECDASAVYGQHSLDLGRANKDVLKWADFNAKMTAYTVPPEVISVVGGNSSGGAPSTAPKEGWNARDLGIMFGRHYTPAVRAPNRLIPASYSSNPGNTTDNPITGPAVGGSIGGLIFLAALAVCIFLARRRDHCAQEASTLQLQHHIPPPSLHVELPGDLARSYSAVSPSRFAHPGSPDAAAYTGTPLSGAQYVSPPPPWHGSWASPDRSTPACSPCELVDSKEQGRLVLAHELPTIRTPVPSARHSRLKEEDMTQNKTS